MSTAEDTIKSSLERINTSQQRFGMVDNQMINDVDRRMTVELYGDDGTLVANIGVFRIKKDENVEFDEFTLVTASYFMDGSSILTSCATNVTQLVSTIFLPLRS